MSVTVIADREAGERRIVDGDLWVVLAVSLALRMPEGIETGSGVSANDLGGSLPRRQIEV